MINEPQPEQIREFNTAGARLGDYYQHAAARWFERYVENASVFGPIDAVRAAIVAAPLWSGITGVREIAAYRYGRSAGVFARSHENQQVELLESEPEVEAIEVDSPARLAAWFRGWWEGYWNDRVSAWFDKHRPAADQALDYAAARREFSNAWTPPACWVDDRTAYDLGRRIGCQMRAGDQSADVDLSAAFLSCASRPAIAMFLLLGLSMR